MFMLTLDRGYMIDQTGQIYQAIPEQSIPQRQESFSVAIYWLPCACHVVTFQVVFVWSTLRESEPLAGQTFATWH